MSDMDFSDLDVILLFFLVVAMVFSGCRMGGRSSQPTPADEVPAQPLPYEKGLLKTYPQGWEHPTVDRLLVTPDSIADWASRTGEMTDCELEEDLAMLGITVEGCPKPTP